MAKKIPPRKDTAKILAGMHVKRINGNINLFQMRIGVNVPEYMRIGKNVPNERNLMAKLDLSKIGTRG